MNETSAKSASEVNLFSWEPTKLAQLVYTYYGNE